MAGVGARVDDWSDRRVGLIERSFVRSLKMADPMLNGGFTISLPVRRGRREGRGGLSSPSVRHHCGELVGCFVRLVTPGGGGECARPAGLCATAGSVVDVITTALCARVRARGARD